MSSHNYCIIMAGGSGTRFWPISREKCPKQFLRLTPDGKSFIRMAYERFADFIPAENILVVTLDKYRDQVFEHIPELPAENLLLEPYGRNTGPCLALATYSLLKRDPEAVLVATPADQIITGMDLFRDSITGALEYAAGHDALITIGIVPDRPDTNFGYIQAMGGAVVDNWDQPRKIKTFTEKPNKELAEVFVASGEFFWNSSIFVSKAEMLQREMEKCAPQITGPFKGWKDWIGSESEKTFLRKVYMQCEMAPFDIAILEKTTEAWVFPGRFGWNDIGTWEAYYDFLAEKDAQGNSINVDKSIIRRTSDSMVYTTSAGKLVVLKGMSGMMVIDTDDVLLICPRAEYGNKEIKATLAMPDFEKFR